MIRGTIFVGWPTLAAALLAAVPGMASAQEPVATGLAIEDFSPWSMFLHADTVVKAVMLGLAFASIVTWTIWLAKSLELRTERRRLVQELETIGRAPDLASAGSGLGVGRALIAAAAEEWRQSAAVLDDRDGLKERVASHLERIEAAAARRLSRGTGILATIGATAPFVGLFGTVWGIMNSFIGIARSHVTNLAVVAPGIAEALLATACGLVAAIPAVVIYNHFARQIATDRALVGDIAAAILRLVSRDLSHEPDARDRPAALALVAE